MQRILDATQKSPFDKPEDSYKKRFKMVSVSVPKVIWKFAASQRAQEEEKIFSSQGHKD